MLPLSLRTIIAKVGKDLYIDHNGIFLTSLVHFNHISLLGFTFFQGKRWQYDSTKQGGNTNLYYVQNMP